MNYSPKPVLSWRARPLALPWVVLCLLAYLGSAAHFVLVQHRTCLEHGEWVHEGGPSSSPSIGEGLERVSFADSRLTRSPPPAPAHEVDAHCAQAQSRRVTPPSVSTLSVPAAPHSEASEAVAMGELIPPPVAWLRLAPKASPPQA